MCTIVDEKLSNKFRRRRYAWKRVLVSAESISAIYNDYTYEIGKVIEAEGIHPKPKKASRLLDRMVEEGAFHLYAYRENARQYDLWPYEVVIRVEIIEYIGAGIGVMDEPVIVARKIRIEDSKAIREAMAEIKRKNEMGNMWPNFPA